MNAPTIVRQPAPPINFVATVIAYLEQQGERTDFVFVDAVVAELHALIAKTGDYEIEAHDIRYATMVVNDEPIGYDDLPAALWIDW